MNLNVVLSCVLITLGEKKPELYWVYIEISVWNERVKKSFQQIHLKHFRLPVNLLEVFTVLTVLC